MVFFALSRLRCGGLDAAVYVQLHLVSDFSFAVLTPALRRSRNLNYAAEEIVQTDRLANTDV